MFHTILASHFIQAYNFLSDCSTPPPCLLKTNNTFLLKVRKDLMWVSNYRPISFLNVNLEFQILANRSLSLLPSLNSMDKVGFVPGCEARDNTFKALSLHSWLTDHCCPDLYFSLNVEKAFNLRLGLRDRSFEVHWISRVIPRLDTVPLLLSNSVRTHQWPHNTHLCYFQWHEAGIPCIAIIKHPDAGANVMSPTN